MSDIFGDEGAEFETEAAPLRQAEREEVQEPEPEQRAEAPVERTEKPVIGDDSKVPLAALNESRAQLRQTQSELLQIKQSLAQFEQLKAELEQSRQTAKKQQEEQQFNQDPLGMIQRQIQELSQELKESQTKREETVTNRQQQEAQEHQLFNSIASQVQEFKKTAPDYDDALQHVLEARRQELMTMGATEFDAQNRVAAEAQEIAISALRAGQNPGQIVYQLAKLRGYDAKRNSEKLATIQKGQEASKSLAGASGSPSQADISLTEIDNMSDEEFDRFWEKNMKAKNR